MEHTCVGDEEDHISSAWEAAMECHYWGIIKGEQVRELRRWEIEASVSLKKQKTLSNKPSLVQQPGIPCWRITAGSPAENAGTEAFETSSGRTFTPIPDPLPKWWEERGLSLGLSEEQNTSGSSPLWSNEPRQIHQNASAGEIRVSSPPPHLSSSTCTWPFSYLSTSTFQIFPILPIHCHIPLSRLNFRIMLSLFISTHHTLYNCTYSCRICL